MVNDIKSLENRLLQILDNKKFIIMNVKKSIKELRELIKDGSDGLSIDFLGLNR